MGAGLTCGREGGCCSPKDGGKLLFGVEGGELETKLVTDDKVLFSGDGDQKSASSNGVAPVPKEYSIVINRTSEKTPLGLDVDYSVESDSLPVRAVTGGLIAAWNAAHPDRRVVENDHIVEVNGDRQVVDLLMDRLANDTVLNITFLRVGHGRLAVCHLGPNGIRVSSDSEESIVRGTVRLMQIGADTCRIEYEIHGLAPGKHAFRIHEKLHGLHDEQRHVEDLGNIEADITGVATGFLNDHLLKLDGGNSVVGTSFMVHADPDAGAGLAFGEIQLVSAASQ